MSSIVYEEVALTEMTYEDGDQIYYYQCPCGDKFEISLQDLYDGEDIAPCPSCTLQIRVLFKEGDLPVLRPEEDDDEDDQEGQKRDENRAPTEAPKNIVAPTKAPQIVTAQA